MSVAITAEAEAEAKQIERQRQYNLRCEIDADKVWNDLDFKEEKIDSAVDNSPGWKTVRIFVSSTFKDFHQEREDLVKKVFYDLREWCEKRQLHLIDCDLRWGVPAETTSELILKTCLEEIDRCYKFNKVPYFVNMICKRIGWIPLEEEVPRSLIDKYALVFGLSVTEMEIVHAAYRIENPNALFLVRDDSFLDEIEDKSIRAQFIDDLQPKAEEKLKILRDKIATRYPPERVITYTCKYNPDQKLYSSYGPKIGRPKLDLDPELCEKVKNFFIERIGQQYPVVERKVDAFDDARFQHEAFMRSRCESGQRLGEKDDKEPEMVIGREDVLSEIDDYIKKSESGSLLLITGEPGTGKSSIMARAACDTLKKKKEKILLGSEDCKVFFHFTGAVPNSTSLMWILKRLLKELDHNIEFPEKVQDVATLVRGTLTASPTPVVIFIDAINQISRQTQIDPLFWIPERLSPNVRCVLSLISVPELLQKNKEIKVPPLLTSQRQKIVDTYLGQFIKKLSADQYAILWDKSSSSNPLWLRIACEELRVFGEFESIKEFMEKIKDGLPELIEQVLERFEAETDKVLLEATLCLLEVSEFGLLETELLELLADKDHLKYSEAKPKESPEHSSAKEKGSCCLPYAEWVSIYRNLRPFLRPYGNPNEGRLDFYHRTLSEVVRDRYLVVGKKSGTDSCVEKCRWWRRKLAEFYRNSSRIYDRKVEEYPRHLIYLKQHSSDETEAGRYCQWMQDFLSDMEVFKRLYDDEFSEELLLYWRESGDGNYEQMCKKYLRLSEDIEGDPSYQSGDRCLKFEQFSHIMSQAGRYEESLRMALKCLDLLKNSSDEMGKEEYNEKLMYTYGQIAHVKYYDNRDKKPVERYEEIIDWHSKAIQIIKDNGWESHARFRNFLALQLNKIAFSRSVICRNYDSSFLEKLFSSKKNSKKEMLAQGIKEVDEAIRIYKELKDYGHELEALCTKGDLHFENRKEQLKIFEEARDRCRLIFGDEHPLMCRLCYNTAIAYERAEDYKNAYEFVHKAFEIGLKVYGSDHAMTNEYREMLRYKTYTAIAKRRGHTID